MSDPLVLSLTDAGLAAVQAASGTDPVVIAELAVITWIRWKYMDTPPVSAAMQVGFGGVLVFATGILIGSG